MKGSFHFLYNYRSHRVLREVGIIKSKRPPTLNKALKDKKLNKLQQLATDILAKKFFKNEFHEITRNYKHLVGRGLDEKTKIFKDWYESKIGNENCVYFFKGAKGRCLYIGSTQSGKRRPIDHFQKHWVKNDARTTYVYPVKNASEVLKLECLAIHQFRPKYNKNRPAYKKWYKTCPVCKALKSIESEVRKTFRLK